MDYHGGGAAAMFEPLTQNLADYDYAMAQLFGEHTAIHTLLSRRNNGVHHQDSVCKRATEVTCSTIPHRLRQWSHNGKLFTSVVWLSLG